MRIIKFYDILSVMILFFLLSATAGCVSSKYKAPALPEWAVGILKTDDISIRIAYIDGQKATGKLRGEAAGELPDTVILAPGFHQITPCYTGETHYIYGDILRFYVQKEQDYVLSHKIKWDKTVKFWIEHKGIDITTEY